MVFYAFPVHFKYIHPIYEQRVHKKASSNFDAIASMR